MKQIDHAARLAKLLDKVSVRDGAAAPATAWTEPVLDPEEGVLNEFLRAFLIWEAGVPAAMEAAGRLAAQVVDFNDLRVCVPEDLYSVLGAQFPLASERCERLRAALTDQFRRTHGVSMEHVGSLSKREARAYLDSLDGVPPFVSARVVLVRFDVHAMPMDRRLLARLVEAGALPEGATPEEAADQIQRHYKAGELGGVYAGLQAWADAPAEAPARGTGRSRAKQPSGEDGEAGSRR